MKRNIILLFFLLFSISSKAQTFYTSNQQILKDIVINSFFVIEQSYQLEDTINNQRFGRNNQPEFGKLRRLAVKTQKGCIVSNDVLFPWCSDPDCTQYLGRYKGVISNTIAYEISDTIASARDFSTDLISEKNQYISSINDSIFSNKGFKVVIPSRKTEGWVVWITAKKGLDMITSGNAVSYQIYKKEIAFTEDSLCYEIIGPTTDDNIIGGIYIVPGEPQIGILEFNISGVMIKNNENWKLIPLKFLNSTDENDDREVVNLTPITQIVQDQQKGSKKKKNKRS